MLGRVLKELIPGIWIMADFSNLYMYIFFTSSRVTCETVCSGVPGQRERGRGSMVGGRSSTSIPLVLNPRARQHLTVRSVGS